MKYTRIPESTFQKLQMNAGIIVDTFNPATGEIGNIIGATSGGVAFSATPTYKDLGEDVDNAPKNVKEFKIIESIDVSMSGTFLTIDASTAKMLIASGDVDENDATHVVPRRQLEQGDFSELWWVGDYSDVNTGENAGFMAIHIMNALNTGGFQIQSSDKGKNQFAFQFTAHASLVNQDVVPYEVYVRAGSAVVTPSINLNKHSTTIAAGETETLVATVVPESASVIWGTGSDAVATVSDGVVSAVAAGNTIISASIVVDGVTYNDTCTVVVSESEG